jgi:NlpC/P60 family
MTDIFQVGKVGTLKDRHEFDDLDKVLDSLDSRLDGIAGPFQIRRPEEDFSNSRSKEDTIERVRELLDKNDGGIRLVIRGSEPKGPVIALRRTIRIDGSEVIQEAIRNIGVPYDFGSMNPAGRAGGPGAELDCSGLVCVCYAVVDVHLPHQAKQIQRDSQVEHFSDPALIRPGDIVLYHTGSQGFPPNEADHCAILIDSDRQIAAPAPGELVQRQPVNMAALLTFGFVEAVTGAH